MFGEKTFGKHTGYPTPETTPETTSCLTLQIPTSSAWWAIYTGLLLSICSEDAWQQYEGGMSREDAAAEAFAIFTDANERAQTDSCDITVPAPYWDDETDVDAEEPVEDQAWYGEAAGEPLTFVERVGIWVITGFIAYSGQIGAAITFTTIAPRFVLAWKTGDLGGIIRIVIDSADAGTVDTYSASPGLLERDFVGDPEVENHTVLQVLESVP